jgi:protease II
VPPGTYTLFLLPTQNEWTLVINKQTGMSGLSYDATQDVGRVKLTTETLSTPAEWFTIDLANNTLRFAWDRTRAAVPFAVK